MNEKELLTKLYWQENKSIQEIADELGWAWGKAYYRIRRKYKIPTHKSLWQTLDIDDSELRICLNNKWSHICSRFAPSDNMSEADFISLCNRWRDTILKIWNKYQHTGLLKDALSIDRLDTSLGYTVDNVQFVCNGYNSWKDHICPIRLVKDETAYYFSTAEEAGRYFDCRGDDIREVLRGCQSNRQGIQVDAISIKQLLDYHSCSSLNDYYHNKLVR